MTRSGYRLPNRQCVLAKGARTMSEHKAEEIKGRVKEAVGDMTGDRSLEREGKVDRASAATKKTVDKATDAVKNVIKPKE
jgi:uncharacterized protein YjbJ (UPF0337 family)